MRTCAWGHASFALLTFALAGCQSVSNPLLISAIPVYATMADARAVAAGQFGAVPIEIIIESELEVPPATCSSAAAQVQLRSGKVGWIPVESLPPSLRNCQQNPSQTFAWKQF
jgi:hypothetical protein